jgi:hypothetical protein
MNAKLLRNVCAAHGERFGAELMRLINAASTREDCMVIADYLATFAVQVQGLIDDGCYERAFQIDKEAR